MGIEYFMIKLKMNFVGLECKLTLGIGCYRQTDERFKFQRFKSCKNFHKLCMDRNIFLELSSLDVPPPQVFFIKTKIVNLQEQTERGHFEFLCTPNRWTNPKVLLQNRKLINCA